MGCRRGPRVICKITFLVPVHSLDYFSGGRSSLPDILLIYFRDDCCLGAQSVDTITEPGMTSLRRELDNDTFDSREQVRMPFGFKYSMVYLPDFNRESFLLFVHNPAGETKLRDYSGDETRVLGQPRRQAVLGGTVEGRTRFLVEPHLTTDHGYWNLRTQEFNSRYLSSAKSVRASVIANEDPVERGGHVSQWHSRTSTPRQPKAVTGLCQ
jgi:hypothetical protein